METTFRHGENLKKFLARLTNHSFCNLALCWVNYPSDQLAAPKKKLDELLHATAQ